MLMSDDGYAIQYYPSGNNITISLPQTLQTVIDSSRTISNRKVDLTTEEQTLILNIVRKIFNPKKRVKPRRVKR